MEKDEINKLTPKQILELLASVFESSREENDQETLGKGIEISSQVNTSKFSKNDLATFHYFVGNAWSYLYHLKQKDGEFPFEGIELNQQIISYRSALIKLDSETNRILKCQILTNLGNLFSTIGRFSEAQDYYDRAISLESDFGMAIGNKGYGIFSYARVIFDQNQQFIFFHKAYQYLLASNKPNVYEDAWQYFENTAKHIETRYKKEALNQTLSFKDFFKRKPQKEVTYRKWCMKNKLFLNPLNDIIQESVATTDYLFTPSMTFQYNEEPIYFSIFNQIKQEFVSSRFIFYEAINSNKPHFSDKEVKIIDTLDYATYSYNLEKVKIAFRVSYSILDKVAYFLNLYLDLGDDPNRVSFRNIWYDKDRITIKSKIHDRKNWALRGLFWLSKDFYEKGFIDTIEPDSKEIAIIRNFIEHKAFKIVDFNTSKAANKNLYTIDRNSFLDKSFKLLKLTRSAILYLSFIIYEEESERNKKRDPNHVVVPMFSVELYDNYKT